MSKRNIQASDEMRALLAKEYQKVFGVFGSQAEAGRRLGLKATAVQRYVSGKNIMSKDVAIRIANQIGINPKRLSAEMMQEDEVEERLKALREEGDGGD